MNGFLKDAFEGIEVYLFGAHFTVCADNLLLLQQLLQLLKNLILLCTRKMISIFNCLQLDLKTVVFHLKVMFLSQLG